ncbi:MAG: RadC family protein [Clostridia bacterium]|nr:RadC family protein [Clostridia bacterium]
MAQETEERIKGVHDGHKERMRNRFLENGGFTGFSEHEILELLLNYANVRQNTNDIAHHLIRKFGSLMGVIEADAHELMKIKGVGERTAALIGVQRELFRIYGERKFNIENETPKLEDSDYVETGFFPYVSTLFTGASEEQFYMICVSTKSRMSKAQLIGKGSSDCVIVNQKTLIKNAIDSDAKGVILIHNHLTGIAVPSNADIENTIKLRNCLKLVEIDLIDHFIYTEKGCVSILQDSRYKYIK